MNEKQIEKFMKLLDGAIHIEEYEWTCLYTEDSIREALRKFNCKE